MSRSQFQSKRFILRHAWLNLWDERMTTGRINQIAIFRTPGFSGMDNMKWNHTIRYGSVSFPPNPTKAPTFSGSYGQCNKQDRKSCMISNFPTLPNLQLDKSILKTTSRFNCQEKQRKADSLTIKWVNCLASLHYNETLGAFWDRFEQILVTGARLRLGIHSQGRAYLVRSDSQTTLSGSHTNFDHAWIMVRSTALP